MAADMLAIAALLADIVDIPPRATVFTTTRNLIIDKSISLLFLSIERLKNSF